MLGLTIILYLITLAVIRMKIGAIAADTQQLVTVANDAFMPADLRQQARLAIIGAQIHLVVCGVIGIFATVIEIALIVYLW